MNKKILAIVLSVFFLLSIFPGYLSAEDDFHERAKYEFEYAVSYAQTLTRQYYDLNSYYDGNITLDIANVSETSAAFFTLRCSETMDDEAVVIDDTNFGNAFWYFLVCLSWNRTSYQDDDGNLVEPSTILDYYHITFNNNSPEYKLKLFNARQLDVVEIRTGIYNAILNALKKIANVAPEDKLTYADLFDKEITMDIGGVYKDPDIEDNSGYNVIENIPPIRIRFEKNDPIFSIKYDRADLAGQPRGYFYDSSGNKLEESILAWPMYQPGLANGIPFAKFEPVEGQELAGWQVPGRTSLCHTDELATIYYEEAAVVRAVYKDDLLTVTFVNDDSKGTMISGMYGNPSRLSFEVGRGTLLSELDLPEIQPAENYRFNGWKYNGTVYNEDNDLEITESITLEADYTQFGTYEIKFDYRDPEADPGEVVLNIEEGISKTLEELVAELGGNPERPGYEFTGWYPSQEAAEKNDDESRYASDAVFSAATVLYAGWSTKADAVVVTLNYHDADRVPQKERYETVDGKLPAEADIAPSKSAYVFTGWYASKEAAAANNEEQKIADIANQNFTENTELHAGWRLIQVTFHYIYNEEDDEFAFLEGYPEFETKMVNPETGGVDYFDVPHQDKPLPPGYTFEGWYLTPEEAYDMGYYNVINYWSYRFTEDTDLYAGWNYVYIFFDLNYDTNEEIPPVPVNDEWKIEKPQDPSREGYVFEGWYYDKINADAPVPDPDLKVDFANDTFDEPIVLYARWRKVDVEVTFHMNYDGADPEFKAVKADETTGRVTIQDPERKGYTFKGWYRYKPAADYLDQAQLVALENATFTENTELWAGWEQNQVTFDLNYEGAPEPESVLIGSDNKVSYANPERDGYIFAGWYRSQEESETQAENTAVDLETTEFTQSVTLYAGWKHIMVTSGLNYKGAPEAEQVPVDAQYKVSKEDPERAGYIFKGWFNGTEKVDLENTEFHEDTVLKAAWERKPNIWLISLTSTMRGQIPQLKLLKPIRKPIRLV